MEFKLEDLLDQFVKFYPHCEVWTVKDLEKRIRDAANKNLPAAEFYAGLCQLLGKGLVIFSA